MLKKIKSLFINKDKTSLKIKNEKNIEELSPFINKAKGSIYGLAIGDALGAPLEFQRMTEGEGISGFVEGGVHKVQKGQFTDDTSMALALMDSLSSVGFDLKDQIERYVLWQKQGQYSSKGYCFDIGITTTKALDKYRITKNPISGGSEHYNSGNGSLMRLAPVPLFYYKDGVETMISKSLESSVTTHQSDIVLDSLKYFVVIYEKILSGEVDKSKLLYLTDEEILRFNIQNETVLDLLQNFDYHNSDFEDINPSGFVLHSIITSLYSLYHSKSFKEALLMAVNFGGDADTNGAIAGQLAGAYYGYNNIPSDWGETLNPKEMIDTYTEPFLDAINDSSYK